MVTETDTNFDKSLWAREGGKAASALLRSGEANGIVVQRMEHVFSSCSQAVTFLDWCLDEGYTFLCVQFIDDQPLALPARGASCSTGDIVRGLAGLDRLTAVERMRLQIQARGARGRWVGRPPYGFRIENGLLVENPDRIKNILAMKRAHRRGRSYRSIAERFGISVATTHHLIKTDLRRLCSIGQALDKKATATPGSQEQNQNP